MMGGGGRGGLGTAGTVTRSAGASSRKRDVLYKHEHKYMTGVRYSALLATFVNCEFRKGDSVSGFEGQSGGLCYADSCERRERSKGDVYRIGVEGL